MERNNSSFFTNDKIYSFVDRRTTAEEDKLFFARMAKDKDFASLIEDLIDASDAITEYEKDKADISFDFSRTAIAAFCDDNLDKVTSSNEGITTDAITAQQAKNMADDFLDSLEENESDYK